MPVHRYTLRPGNDPTIRDGEVRWSCPNLDITGTWSMRSAGFRRTLLDGPEGSIRWHCLSPSAAAEVRIGDLRLAGAGYAEHLTMTVKPWRLPFSELRWGRFVGHTDSLIWIQWCGQTSRTWVWWNGLEQARCKVGEERVEIPHAGLLLELSDHTELRSGPLAATALRSVRPLVGLIPRWRRANETKWLARGTLNQRDKTDTGWVIHEIVRWP